MDGSLSEGGGFGAPGRLAGPAEGITPQELALAARNHGLPLEALRYDVTPPGLHYVLVHYDIPATDPEGWRLTVGGRVLRTLDLDLEGLRARPAVTRRVTLECAGNGRARLTPRPISQPWLVEAVGTADWTGVPLAELLAEAGTAEDAVEAVFTGADHGVERGVEQDYRRSLPLPVAADPARDVLVAYAMNGAPLPPQHGSPLRLVVPGWYGMAHVKWLRDITVTATPYTGFQQSVAYRIRGASEEDEPGEPVTLIAPRALMIPPGFPDFMSRVRVVRPGPVRLAGRAWSGHGPVTRVEVGEVGVAGAVGEVGDVGQLGAEDGSGAAAWTDAVLDHDPAHPWAWSSWHTTWQATPGRHHLAVRATDAAGHVQPLAAPWNRGGFANNLVQRVEVHCAPDTSAA
ncbi:sulfite oxidase [Streptomyces sp. NPDC059593]|uniref:sulfite oxidase n=1 Tax=Streptomyces sp. NPDC059593 TaxID=3346878 RepID=UPI0036AC9ADC